MAKTTKKSAPTKSSSTASVSSGAPHTHAPSVPSGFTPLGRKESAALGKLTDSQLAEARAVAAEVTASKVYGDLGADAPPAKALADALIEAASWAEEADAAERYALYAESQKQHAADRALALASQAQLEFDHVAKKHPDLTAKLPILGKFLGARGEAGKRGAATKRKKKKAAKKSA